MDLKFEKLIRLTESDNDHEALSALRFAQGLCKKNGHNFTNFLLNGSNFKNNSSIEVNELKRKISIYSLELSQLESQFNVIYEENMKLKKKIKSSNASKNLKEKYKKLKDELEYLEEEHEEITKISNIYDDVYNCHPSKRENVLKELVSSFIEDKSIKINVNEWRQTRELYDGFIEVCHDVQILSLKKFSQILSILLGAKPVRGGVSLVDGPKSTLRKNIFNKLSNVYLSFIHIIF
ncbi:hypothetical protein JCM31447_31710 (plasmid) [Fluviispira sanaruensis]|uniref:Uncharacterized protein n=2 Tax=Fluviispira sanaruensis TaxID=2493639 RepID=A0A4V0P2X0_FLUSA|nr:hypothetical protein JCM31447_31710 [Fluviispira sanaruensis]